MSSPSPALLPRPSSAFTLLELIAVLAVLTLMLWLSADGALARGKRIKRQAEAAELTLLADTWIQAALRIRTLPAATNWVDWLAAGSSLPPLRIARNGSGYMRQLVFDPVARFGRPLEAAPFVQSATGSLEPARPRLLLVSSLSDDLPDLSTLSFDAMWTNAPEERPTGWPATWVGEPGDLLIERLDLRARFHRMVLHNLDGDAAAGYAVTRVAASLPGGGAMEGWFLSGSVVELKLPDGSVQAAEVLSEDVSYVFERRRWRRQITDGPARTGGLGALADQFLSAPWPPATPLSPADQAAIVDESVSYLRAYATWSAEGFPVTGGTGPGANPWHRSVTESQARLRDFTQHLISP